MKELKVSLLWVADKSGVSYEHIRKLSRGAAILSPLMLKEVCDIVGKGKPG
jgi:hypothetical protein